VARGGWFLVSRKLEHDYEFWSYERIGIWVAEILSMTANNTRLLRCGVILEPGEVLLSTLWCSRRWRWGRKKVRGFLDKLVERESLAVVRSTPFGTVYRVLNWRSYQQPRPIVEPSGATKRATLKPVQTGLFAESGATKRATPTATPPREAETRGQPPARNHAGFRDIGANIQKQELPRDTTEERDNISLTLDVISPNRPLDRLLRGEELSLEDRAAAILGAWIVRYEQITGLRPAEPVIRKQAVFARRAATLTSSSEEAMRMVVGIEELFPYSEGRPWDCADLARMGHKAIASFDQHPGVQDHAMWQEFAARQHERSR